MLFLNISNNTAALNKAMPVKTIVLDKNPEKYIADPATLINLPAKIY